MSDYSPGDDRSTVPHEKRGSSRWLLLSFIVVLLAGGAYLYQFRPDRLAGANENVGGSHPVTPPKVDKADAEFAPLYVKYAMTPLGAEVASVSNVHTLLLHLQKEPCDKQVIYQASVELEGQHATRGAAEMLNGFARVCPDASGEQYRSSELFLMLGDYITAARLSGELIDQQPDAQKPYYVRARAEQGLNLHDAAVEDYATLIRLLPDPKSIASEVFMRMSESYDKLGHPCEAIGPIQIYIALDSTTRSTPQLLRRISKLAEKGTCDRHFAKGAARVPRRFNGVATAKVEVNGNEGTFIVDTGASFVTLTKAFAAKVKPKVIKGGDVEIQTANGTGTATLATLDSVRLNGLSASGVPAIVANKSLGDGIDGLLGMSFLSRYAIVITNNEIRLEAKNLGTEAAVTVGHPLSKAAQEGVAAFDTVCLAALPNLPKSVEAFAGNGYKESTSDPMIRQKADGGLAGLGSAKAEGDKDDKRAQGCLVYIPGLTAEGSTSAVDDALKKRFTKFRRIPTKDPDSYWGVADFAASKPFLVIVSAKPDGQYAGKTLLMVVAPK